MIKFNPRSSAFAIMAFCTAVMGYSRQLTLDEALMNAPQRFTHGATRASRNLVYTETEENFNVAYILSGRAGEGYVVIAADDLLPAVLGYADNGSFDPDNIPPAMKTWLKGYGAQLSYSIANGVAPATQSETSSLAAIPPLCSTKWNQDKPYNNNCPKIGDNKAPTGCTATAMAQVIKTHNWPGKGTGINTYLPPDFTDKLSFNFSTAEFDWDNMIDDYSGRYSEDEAKAVAILMEACGNAALMQYGSNASGAYIYDGVYGMVKFLKYDKSAYIAERDYFPLEEWIMMLYDELSDKRAVIYSGYNASDGHTFVIDGYDDGYFHINWGWGGMSDGYFLITGLDPANQGIGGSSGGYNTYQSAAFNIMPETATSSYVTQMYCQGAFSTQNNSYSNSERIEFVADGGYFKAVTFEDEINVTAGIILVPVNGGEKVFYRGSEQTYHSIYGMTEEVVYQNFYVDASSLPKSGEYIAVPAFSINGEVQEMHGKVGAANSVTINCTATGVTIESNAPQRVMTATGIKLQSFIYTGKTTTLSATVSNEGDEYLDTLCPALLDSSGEVVASFNGGTHDIAGNESVDITFSGIFKTATGFGVTPGDYYLTICDSDNKSLAAQPLAVKAEGIPSGDLAYTISYDFGDSMSGKGTREDPYLIGDEVEFDMTINVTSGFFDNYVYIYTYEDRGNKYPNLDLGPDSKNYHMYLAGAGKSETAHFILDTSTFPMDQAAFLQAYRYADEGDKDGSGFIGDWIYLKRTSSGINDMTVVSNSGISPNPASGMTTVTANAPIRAIDVYSINGTKVIGMKSSGVEMSADLNLDHLSHGHYIVVVSTTEGIERHRLIRR